MKLVYQLFYVKFCLNQIRTCVTLIRDLSPLTSLLVFYVDPLFLLLAC